MKPSPGMLLSVAVLAVVICSSAMAADSSGFEAVTKQYEVIRQALVNDTIDDVAATAGHIQHQLHALENGFSEEAAGVRSGSGDDLRSLLPAIQAATEGLIESATIDDAREAFGALSKAMVQYRQLVPEPVPAVAFCSMAQKVWLQPKGEIGNPYYGQSMARCGEFVSE